MQSLRHFLANSPKADAAVFPQDMSMYSYLYFDTKVVKKLEKAKETIDSQLKILPIVYQIDFYLRRENDGSESLVLKAVPYDIDQEQLNKCGFQIYPHSLQNPESEVIAQETISHDQLLAIFQNLDPTLTIPVSKPLTGVRNPIFFVQHILRHFVKVVGLSKPKIVFTSFPEMLIGANTIDKHPKISNDEIDLSCSISSDIHEIPNHQFKLWGSNYQWEIIHVNDTMFRLLIT